MKTKQTQTHGPICPNCGQWQHKANGDFDCLNECKKRGLVEAAYAQDFQEVRSAVKQEIEASKSRQSTPAQAQHSPLPFRYDLESVDRSWSIITDKNGSIVANVNTETGPDTTSAPATRQMPAESNAQFIVRACNNAQRLADAATYALKAYDNGYDDDQVELTMVGLREALAEWSLAQ